MGREVDLRMFPATMFVIVKTQEVIEVTVNIEMVKQTGISPLKTVALKGKVDSVVE